MMSNVSLIYSLLFLIGLSSATLLKLQVKTLDVRKDKPVRLSGNLLSEPSIFILHLKEGKYLNQTVNEVRDIFPDAYFYGYISENAYFLYAPYQAIEFLESQNDSVFDWISYMDPTWRIDPSVAKVHSFPAENMDLSETDLVKELLVSIVPVPNKSDQELEKVSDDLKQRLQYPNANVVISHEGGIVYRLHSFSNEEELVRAASKLSQVPYVQFVERAIKYIPKMKWVKPWIFNGFIAGSDVDSKFYDSNTVSGIFTETIPVYGNGQIIGLADTGINLNHCFMYNFIQQSQPIVASSFAGNAITGNVTSISSHPRIVQYYSYNHNNVDDGGAHGTFIATIINGNPPASFSEYRQYQGIAPQAKLAVMDLQKGTQSLSVPTNLQNMFNVAYKVGARVYCSSFSGYNPFLVSNYDSNGGYNSHARDIDVFMAANPDMLIVVPSGFATCVNSTFPVGALGYSKVNHDTLCH